MSRSTCQSFSHFRESHPTPNPPPKTQIYCSARRSTSTWAKYQEVDSSYLLVLLPSGCVPTEEHSKHVMDFAHPTSWKRASQPERFACPREAVSLKPAFVQERPSQLQCSAAAGKPSRNDTYRSSAYPVTLTAAATSRAQAPPTRSTCRKCKQLPTSPIGGGGTYRPSDAAELAPVCLLLYLADLQREVLVISRFFLVGMGCLTL